MTNAKASALQRIMACLCIPLLLLLISCSLGGGTDTGNPNVQSGASQPVAIVSVTPSEVKAGADITITGSGFGKSQGTSTLTIGGSMADTIISWSDSEIIAIVPQDAVTGPVKATVQGLSSDEARLIVLWDNSNPQNVGIYGPQSVGNYGNHLSQPNSQLLADGNGGAIIVWNDFRSSDALSGLPQQINIIAQRLNSRGTIVWSVNGVALSAAAGGQYSPQLISDGHGGAIVVWEDYRNGSDADIYAQRISADGKVMWQSDIAVSEAPHAQEKPKIVSDGAGGAIIVWQDFRSYAQYEVYAQRINGNGVPQWTMDGVMISSAANNTYYLSPEIIDDGSGGAIIVWLDYRSNSGQLFAQRVNNMGATQWTNNGVVLSTRVATYQYVPRPVSDGAGGAIIAWESSSIGTDIITQRINNSGALQWGIDGKTVVSALLDQSFPTITTDGSGGAIMTWVDRQAGMTSQDIYGQRISASGTSLWFPNGVPICTAANDQFESQITADSMGGAIIAWTDSRYTYDFTGNYTDVFAQRVNGDGITLWTANGEAISTTGHAQSFPKIVSDGLFGAIILWEDRRSGNSVDLYTQGITTNGNQ